MDINLVRSLFHGATLNFDRTSFRFNLETKVQHIFNQCLSLFRAPSSLTLQSLNQATPITRAFLSQLETEFENLDNLEFFRESEAILSGLEGVSSADVDRAKSKIQLAQGALKTSLIANSRLNPYQSVLEAAPEFIFKDLNFLRSLIESTPEQIKFLPEEVLLKNPDLCILAIRKNELMASHVPESVYRKYPELRMQAVEVSSWALNQIPPEIRENDPELCLKSLKNHFSTISRVPKTVQLLIKKEILDLINAVPRTRGLSKSSIQFLHNEIKEACLDKVLASIKEYPFQIFEYDVDFLISHPELVKEAIYVDSGIFKDLDKQIQSSEEVLKTILPTFASVISKEERLQEEFSKTLSGYRNTEIRTFVISKLIDCEKAKLLGKIPKYASTADITPIFTSAIFSSWRPSEEQQNAFDRFLENNKKALKNAPDRNSLLKFMKDLNNLPILPEKKAIYFDRCILKAGSLKEGIKAAPFLISAFEVLGESGLDELSEFNLDTLKSAATNVLLKEGVLEKEDKERFLEVFTESRRPSAIFAYARKNLEEESFKPILKRFISEVIESNFIKSRHEANSLKGALTEAQKKIWETSSSEMTTLKILGADKSFSLEDSEDWQDLFLCGTEVMGSCQHVDSDPDYNRCLMGYCLDGKVRILTLKDAHNGAILFRSILKIMKNEAGNPCLFFEKVYGSGLVSEEIEASLKKKAKEKADLMGVDCFEHKRGGSLILHSDAMNASGYEYEDAAAKTVTNGIYEVEAKPL